MKIPDTIIKWTLTKDKLPDDDTPVLFAVKLVNGSEEIFRGYWNANNYAWDVGDDSFSVDEVDRWATMPDGTAKPEHYTERFVFDPMDEWGIVKLYINGEPKWNYWTIHTKDMNAEGFLVDNVKVGFGGLPVSVESTRRYAQDLLLLCEAADAVTAPAGEAELEDTMDVRMLRKRHSGMVSQVRGEH